MFCFCEQNGFASDSNLETEEKKEAQNLKKLSFSAGYSIKLDINENKSPKTIHHLFELSQLYSFSKKYSAGLGISFGHFSIGRSIPVDNNVELKEFVVSVGRGFDDFKIFNLPLKLKASAGVVFFLDDASRYEGQRGMPVSSISLLSNLTQKLRLNNSLSAGYILNKYDYSPVSHRSNPMAWGAFSAALSYYILDNFFVSSSIGFKSNRRIDGVLTGAFSNLFAMGYKWNEFLLTVRWLSGRYDDSSLDIVYFDQYRQILMFGITASF